MQLIFIHLFIFQIVVVSSHCLLKMEHISHRQPVDALQAKLLARQVKISQVRVSQALDEILLNASSCGHDHVHLTQTRSGTI